MNYPRPYLETGVRIYQLRQSRHLTREQLAEKADISAQFLFDIENGRKSMSVTTLKKLSSALCVSADFIINGNTTDSALELNAIYHSLSPDKQSYALEILRTFAEAVREKPEEPAE